MKGADACWEKVGRRFRSTSTESHKEWSVGPSEPPVGALNAPFFPSLCIFSFTSVRWFKERCNYGESGSKGPQLTSLSQRRDPELSPLSIQEVLLLQFFQNFQGLDSFPLPQTSQYSVILWSWKLRPPNTRVECCPLPGRVHD